MNNPSVPISYLSFLLPPSLQSFSLFRISPRIISPSALNHSKSLPKNMMNRCAYQQKALGVSGCGEMRRGDSVAVSVSGGGVVCPKPRRLGLLNPYFNDSTRPPRWYSNQQAEAYDSKAAGTELLDMILTKGGYSVEKTSITPVSSSPPFFSGSPPCRASNPVIQDAQFGNERLTPLTPTHESSPRKSGGCVRVKFGQSPTTRVEGFNCRGISAVA